MTSGEAEGGGQGVEVRRATARDIEQIAADLQSVADEGRYLFTERVTEERKRSFARLVEDKGCLVLVAVESRGQKRRLVGSLLMTRYGDAKKSEHVRVLMMLVVKAFRGKGIGSMLMDHALRWAREQPGVEKVALGVFSSNKRALRLYERFGFVVEGVRKDQYYIEGEHEDEIDMALFVK